MRSMFDEELMELKKDNDGEAVSSARAPARPRSRAESLFFQLGLPGMLVAIMSFGFYVFVVRLCIQRLIIGGVAEGTGYLYLTIYCVFWIAFYRCKLTDPGTSPDKPARAHHCRICDANILKMDHHCGVIDCCVGHRNHKFFILFLTYAWLLCYSVPACTAAHWIQFRPSSWANATDIMLGICVALGVVYGTSLLVFAVVHYYFVLTNQTTLEHSLGLLKARNPYDLGLWGNWQSTCGPNPLLWLLPVPSTPGDGYQWGPPTAEKQV